MMPFEIPAALLLFLAATSAVCDGLTIASSSLGWVNGETQAKPVPVGIRGKSVDLATVPNWIEGGYVAWDTALPVLASCNSTVDSAMWNKSNPFVSPPAREPLGSTNADSR
jgi:hypothetical protein